MNIGSSLPTPNTPSTPSTPGSPNSKRQPLIPRSPNTPAPKLKKFWPMRDLPSFIWLALAVFVALGHQWLPEPRWLMIHLVLLGAASHAILVWSQHFANALLHSPATAVDRSRQNARLVLFNVGAVLVFVGVLAPLWVLTLVGACLISVGVVWHAVSLLVRFRRAVGVRFSVTIWYYVIASVMLPLGASLGVLLAHGFADPVHGQLKTGHAILNVFGWIGLTVLGTLVTLWPTMLRTKLHGSATVTARRTLGIFVGGLLLAALGALLGNLWVTAVGLLAYLGGIVWLGSVFVRTAAQRLPRAFCTLSVGAGVVWLAVCVAYLLVGFTRGALSGHDWVLAYASFTQIAPFLAAAFVAQVLIGALAYLIPVMVSSGPASARAANREMDRGAVFRVVTTNLTLVASLLPVPSVVLVLATMLYLGSTASFLVLMIRSMRAAKRPPVTTSAPVPAGSRAGQAAAAVIAVLLVLGVGVAVDPSSMGVIALGNSVTGSNTSGGVDTDIESAPKQTITVEAHDMKFYPASVSVPAGTNVTIQLTNTDSADVHDLVFASGITSGRLAPGDSATIELGIVTDSLDGWCSILGHKQMGMLFEITVEGSTDHTNHNTTGTVDAQAGDGSSGSSGTHNHQSDGAQSAAADLDFMAAPSSDFVARDAALPALPASDGTPTTHKLTFEITEQVMEVAPGVEQLLWTFNGQFPGPALHGRVGDTFEILLVNNGTMGHSIDFHASNLAPDGPMRTIAPGESLTYTFTAERAGIWMYHCGTMPMTAHIANGMAGAVVIEPDDLPDVDKSYLLVQSEMYLGAQGEPVDADKALAGDSQLDLVAFNGYANQYVAQPLPATVGERVRVWALDVGPSRASSFHVVGGQFDRVWFEGAYTLGSADAPADGSTGGSQALAMQPAQGGFIELAFPEAGNYPFVTHIMADAERGAKGIFRVSE